jgi:hypothetical protein
MKLHPNVRQALLAVALIAGGVVALGVFVAIWSWWADPIRALRHYASDIQEYNGTVNFTGDYFRCARAKCTEEAFRAYAKQQGFTKVAESDNLMGDGSHWGWNTCPEPWWTPPPTIIGAYIDFSWPTHHHGTLSLLGYRDGFLYYESGQW